MKKKKKEKKKKRFKKTCDIKNPSCCVHLNARQSYLREENLKHSFQSIEH